MSHLSGCACSKHMICGLKQLHHLAPAPNNRIHSNKQGRAAVSFAKFEENVAFTNASFPACR